MPKTKEFGHSRHVGENDVKTFCPSVEGKVYVHSEAGMAARKAINPQKKNKKISLACFTACKTLLSNNTIKMI